MKLKFPICLFLFFVAFEFPIKSQTIAMPIIFQDGYNRSPSSAFRGKVRKVGITSSINGDKSDSIFMGGELGGVLFFDETAYTTSFKTYSGYKPTKYGQIARLPEDFLEQLKKFKVSRTSNGESTRILLVIHTHPPDPNGSDGEAYSKRASDDDLKNITLSDYGDGNKFGIVIYGKGKFEVYGAGEDGDETLKKNCIKNKP